MLRNTNLFVVLACIIVSNVYSQKTDDNLLIQKFIESEKKLSTSMQEILPVLNSIRSERFQVGKEKKDAYWFMVTSDALDNVIVLKDYSILTILAGHETSHDYMEKARIELNKLADRLEYIHRFEENEYLKSKISDVLDSLSQFERSYIEVIESYNE